MRISANSAFAYVDYVAALKKSAAREEALVYSCFSRSEMELRSFGANISLGNAMLYPEETEQSGKIAVFPKANMDTCHVRLTRGKEQLFHSVSLSQELGGKYILTTREIRDKDIYNWLMSNFDLPLLDEWVPYLLQTGKEQIKEMETIIYGKEQGWMKEIIVYEASLTDAVLQELVADGLRHRGIFIARTPQEPLRFDNMDDYFMKYGPSLIENLDKISYYYRSEEIVLSDLYIGYVIALYKFTIPKVVAESIQVLGGDLAAETGPPLY